MLNAPVKGLVDQTTWEIAPPVGQVTCDTSSEVKHPERIATSEGCLLASEYNKAPFGAKNKREIPGNDLLSHPVARAVPSALVGLTAVFGMGTGVSPPL